MRLSQARARLNARLKAPPPSQLGQPSAQPTTNDVQAPALRKRSQDVAESGSESKCTRLSVNVPQAHRSPYDSVITGTFYDLNAHPAGGLYAAQAGQPSASLVPGVAREDDPFSGQAVAGPSRGGGDQDRPVPKPKPLYRGAAPSAPPAPAPPTPASSAPPTIPAGLDIAALIAAVPPDWLAAALTSALQNAQGPH
ncbi:hypothetical protein B0H12DRAFT_1227937 [Mycena haematopus]|nr:hypothetical protein B0H12DRAFT_1227937 [Mycena haematopus]